MDRQIYDDIFVNIYIYTRMFIYDLYRYEVYMNIYSFTKIFIYIYEYYIYMKIYFYTFGDCLRH